MLEKRGFGKFKAIDAGRRAAKTKSEGGSTGKKKGLKVVNRKNHVYFIVLYFSVIFEFAHRRKKYLISAILLASNRHHNKDQTKKQSKTERERTGKDK